MQGCLGKCGNRESARHIESLLFDEDRYVRKNVSQILLTFFHNTAGLCFLLEAMGTEEEHHDEFYYDLLFELMDNRPFYHSPNYYTKWLSDKQAALDEANAWFRENGKYLEYSNYWLVNEDAKKAGVPVRAWREIPKDLRSRWTELTPEEQAKAVREARERVGRVMELIDKLEI